MGTNFKLSTHSLKCTLCVFTVSSILLLFHTQHTSFQNSTKVIDSMNSKLRDAITFLPLKDLRFSETAMEGHTWFMSSLNETTEENEPQYLLFPSHESKGRVLCLKGRDTKDGTKNSYALAWLESLPDSARFMEGLTFVSDTYFDHDNLWHAMGAIVPFVRWSMNNKGVKPTRWVLFHWGEVRVKMGSWIRELMETNFGDVNIEKFERGEGPYCLEKAVVMRNDFGSMGQDNRLKVFDLLRCKARSFCGIYPCGRGTEVNKKDVTNKVPIIRLTLLTRRGARSFKNESVVHDIISEECAKVEGCIFQMVQSEDLSFCDQVKVMSNTDIVASPHGAQLTNMLFMDRGGNVMEFFPKGWLEYAGNGQYAHHWMAGQTGMHHRGAWWDPVGEDCPNPNNQLECFLFHKDGKIGNNETYFVEWTKKVLQQVKTSKLEQVLSDIGSNACEC